MECVLTNCDVLGWAYNLLKPPIPHILCRVRNFIVGTVERINNNSVQWRALLSLEITF